jgi:hypothetical protein
MEVARMKGIGIISTAALLLLLGIAASGYAEQEKQGEKQREPEKQAEPAKQAKPEQQQHAQQPKQAKPEQQARPAKQVKPEQQQHVQQPKQAKPEQQQHAQQPKQAKPEQQARPAKQAKPEQQQHAQQPKQQDKNKQQQHARQQKQQVQPAGARGGGRIPDDRFRANFGREHTFRVSQADYRGHRFHYGGYWFGFVDPWPSNWLYTQNVYVVDLNGVYYLCNPMYPGVNIALSFTL